MLSQAFWPKCELFPIFFYVKPNDKQSACLMEFSWVAFQWCRTSCGSWWKTRRSCSRRRSRGSYPPTWGSTLSTYRWVIPTNLRVNPLYIQVGHTHQPEGQPPLHTGGSYPPTWGSTLSTYRWVIYPPTCGSTLSTDRWVIPTNLRVNPQERSFSMLFCIISKRKKLCILTLYRLSTRTS